MTQGLAFGLAAAGIVLFSVGRPAIASPVYTGCEAPPERPSGHSFFVDPAHGSPHGDGSRAHPWRTLAEVVGDGQFATAPIIRGPQASPMDRAAAALEKATGATLPRNPNAPIKPGDTVYLLSGDHGVVNLQGAFGPNLVGYANSDFITIEALPGQTPIIRQLKVMGGSKWVFRGLTFESVNDTNVIMKGGSPPQDYWLLSLLGPHENILVDHNHFLSAADVSNWTLGDWVHKRASGVKDYRGKCIAITGNTLEKIGFGLLTQSSDHVLIAGNLIDHFSDDGIDYGSDNLLIDRNRITNSIEDGDGIHRDAMQGQPNTMTSTISNVTISNNTVIRILDPDLKNPAYLQGIDTFDGIWKNVKILNNIVITDAGHGISYYDAHNLVVQDNILLADSMKVLPCSHISFEQCQMVSVTMEKGQQPPRIVVQHGKSGNPSSDVLITRNLATAIIVDLSTVRPRVANNLCVPTDGKCVIGIPLAGRMLWAAKPGRYGENNIITPRDASDFLVKFDPKDLKYDIRLRKPVFKD
jgi:Right handed beta helix region